MSAGEADPIIEAHRIVVDAERRVPIAERFNFAQLVTYRQARTLVGRARAWWLTADYGLKQMVMALLAMLAGELIARIIRPNNGGA